ncbi:MAG: ribosome biogenesis GTPase Der [Erysipelotrichaceae bacterium]|nr:ribosome biogenesis GTPase Der [Erysipelotrichaceae bacterium]
MRHGTVAIVGRPNVGKSSLFNRLAGDKLAITDDASGVTRDRLYAKCEWLDQQFAIIDTGGIELSDVPFMFEIRAQAELAIDEADVIIFVCDGRVGITKEDSDVMTILHKSKKPVIVAANKIDDVKFMDNIYEFYNFGVEEVFAISTLHGIGIGDLLDKIVELLPEKKSKKYDDTIEFCLIGQPNVGKSSLTNAILGTERVIVSDIAGTTRDAIDTPFTRDGADYVVIDTAGIRKTGKIYENAEKYSFLRAIKAIERSSVVLLLLDATKEIEEQDKRVAGYAMDANKAVIIVVNKWDAVEKNDKSMQEWIKKIKSHFVFLDYAPIVFVSALKNQRVHTVFEQIKIVYQNYTRRVATNVLNDVLLDATLIQQAPFFNGDRLKIYYASQVEKNPPSFVLFVNDPNYLHFSYQRYLENKLREAFSFEGTPIKFILRKKED